MKHQPIGRGCIEFGPAAGVRRPCGQATGGDGGYPVIVIVPFILVGWIAQ
jgi:hypothetical protein